ncbi:MAG: hypothetical protein MMC33_010122 [Icmadophila ericetorum]|nr:hypothetical protein [Icmadophila ericetorum]
MARKHDRRYVPSESYYHPPREQIPSMIQQRRYRRWPPKPIVEDLFTSLAHEHNPPPDAFSSDDDVASRGSADQFPIILDAENPQYEPIDRTNTESRSSNESSEPHTPQGHSNADLRYVWKPKEGIEIPLTYDEPREPVQRRRDHSAQPRPITSLNIGGEQGNTQLRDPSQNRPPATANTPGNYGPRPRDPSTIADAPRRDGHNLNIETDINMARAKSQDPSESRTPVRREGTTIGNGMNMANAPRTQGPATGFRPTVDTRSGQETPSPRSTQSSSESGTPSRMRFDARTGKEYPVPMSREAAERGAQRAFTLDLRSGREENNPVTTRREPSPYAYTSSSSKSTFSGDSLLSPDSASPRVARNRASSSSEPKSPRPTFDRHVSAMGYPGEPLPIPRTQRQYDESSDSDSSRRHHRTGSQYTSTRPDLRSQETQPRLIPSQTFPLRPQDPFIDPRRTGTMNNSLPRQQNTPFYSPPASPGPDSRRDRASKGHNPRGSGSRPPSPLAYTPQGSPNPSMTPSWGGRSNNSSRQTSPVPSPQPSPRFETGPILPARMAGLPRPRSRDGAPAPPPRAEPSQNRHRPPALPLKTDSNLLNGFYIPPIFSSPQASGPQAPYCLPSENPNYTPRFFGSKRDPPQSRQSSAGSTSLTPLPPCPRSTFSAEPENWYILAGNDMFHVCSTCRRAVEDAGYDRHFARLAPLAPGTRVRCDFSRPWMRMAWLLTLKENLPHVNLLHSFAYIIQREQPCPGNIGSAKHDWYRLYDPETRRDVANFDVCSHCVRSVESLFPNLRGIFVPAPRDDKKRVCDLTTDSPRFAAYADLLESISNEARVYRRPPNISRLIALARQQAQSKSQSQPEPQPQASPPPCPEDVITYNRAWHYIPNLPEFTICKSCFEKHVTPVIKDGSELAGRFSKAPMLLPPDVEADDGGSCRIWTKGRVEKFWRMCAEEDLRALRSWARRT